MGSWATLCLHSVTQPYTACPRWREQGGGLRSLPLGRSEWAELEGENKRGEGGENRGGALPLSYFMHLTGPCRAIKLLSAPAPPPPTVWALKPLSWAPPCLGLSMANICVCTRRYAGMHMIYTALWAPNGTRLLARCHFTGPKKLSISRAQPPPTCPRKGCCMHQKHYEQGQINHRCINSYLIMYYQRLGS